MKKKITGFVLLTLFLCSTLNYAYANKGQDKSLNNTNFNKLNLGGDAYVFGDAITYKGEVFTVQIYNEDQIRLIHMAQDSQTGQLSFDGNNYWTLNEKDTKFLDASLTVWCDKIFVVWSKKNDANDLFYMYVWFDNNNKLQRSSEYCVPADYGNDDSFNKIKAISYQDTLQVYFQADNKLVKSKTGQKINGDENINLGFPKSAETFSLDNSSVWDIALYNGEINGMQDEWLLYVSQNNAYFWQDGSWKAASASHNKCSNAYDIKLVQGAVYGLSEGFTDAQKNVMYIVASIGGEDDCISLISLFPSLFNESNYTGEKLYTGIDDGYMGVTTSVSRLKENPELFRQYIHIISSYPDEKNFASLLVSNIAKIQVKEQLLKLEDLKDFPKDIRDLFKLVAVIEGPPPSSVNTPEAIAVSKNYEGIVSSLQLTSQSSEGFSTKESYSFEKMTSISTKRFEEKNKGTKGSFGELFEEEYSESKEVSMIYEQSIDLTSEETLSKGILLYSIPELKMYSMDLFIPESISYDFAENERIPGYPTNYSLVVNKIYYQEVKYPLTDVVSGIENVSDIESWGARDAAPVLAPVTPSIIVSSGLNYSAKTVGLSEKLTESKLTTDGVVKSKDKEKSFFFLHFSIETTSEWKYTTTSQKELSKEVKVYFPMIEKNKPELEGLVENFITKLYLISESEGVGADVKNKNYAADFYYERLKKYELPGYDGVYAMTDNDRPLIFAWNILSLDSSSEVQKAVLGTNRGDKLQKLQWFTYTPEKNGFLNAYTSDLGAADMILLRMEDDMGDKKDVFSTYDTETGLTKVEIEVEQNNPILIAVNLLSAKENHPEWVLEWSETSVSNEIVLENTFSIGQSGDALYVNWPEGEHEMLNMTIYDMSGRLLSQVRGYAAEAFRIGDLISGYYIIKVASGNVVRSNTLRIK